jgi:3'-phosphoadenosine 5'-phosphosulfate sulfotransferase (PAPS reductase)/FAD synthetase
VSQGFLNFGYPALDLSNAPVDVRKALVIASTSSGKDSSAASLLLKKNGIEHRRVFMNTKWESHHVYEYLRGPLTEALGPIEEIESDRYEGFIDLVLQKGLFPSRVMRFCTEELKVFPILKMIEAVAETETREIVNVVGIRRHESKKRAAMPEWEFSDTFHCWIWRPIIEWHKADVIAIHDEFSLDINPLYHLGASRVGCWPCIHARKAEVALVARVDPGRIDEIEDKERILNEEGKKRDDDLERPFVIRSMFSYHGGDSKHFPLPIRDAVEWANSNRGEWQPKGDDGCARYGFCSANPEEDEEEETAQLQLVRVLR